jgi:hypothetical protein
VIELALFLLPTLVYCLWRVARLFGPGWQEDWQWAKVVVEETNMKEVTNGRDRKPHSSHRSARAGYGTGRTGT